MEWQNVHGSYYGTSVNNLENAINNDKIMLIEMDEGLNEHKKAIS